MSDKTHVLKVDANGRISIPEELLSQHDGYTFEIEMNDGKVIFRVAPLQEEAII
jgi:bifunctional DNA-binding transcriptional regulator/antitoxin component of YhaV-PrlF toxin-antitoxin module